MKKGYLLLKNGCVFEGEIRGYQKEAIGEVVFTTGMVGYCESMTDPSYSNQILVFTYPLIGNYGIFEKKGFESEKIHTSAIVVSEICDRPSHFNIKFSLEKWCVKNKISILSGIDTRLLTQKLRNYGTLSGGIFFNKNKKLEFKNTESLNLINGVSSSDVKIFFKKDFDKTVVLYDCGVKMSIIKSLQKRNIRVIKVPWDYDYKKIREKFSGIVISNGPGDPQKAKILIERVKELIKSKIPILGICLGNQILSIALGAKTRKLKFGHRSQNQPVTDLKNKKCYITSQNHGYVVESKKMPKGLEVWFENLNDNTCEGVYHKKYPILGVQFHPEANPGPTDTDWIFDLFKDSLKKYGK